jgi:hypothetical protein
MKYRSLTFGLVRRPQMVRPLMRTWKLPAPAKRFLGNEPPLERRHWLHCLKGQAHGVSVHKELPTHAEFLVAPSIVGLRGIGMRLLPPL